jgi:hypothetical protein
MHRNKHWATAVAFFANTSFEGIDRERPSATRFKQTIGYAQGNRMHDLPKKQSAKNKKHLYKMLSMEMDVLCGDLKGRSFCVFGENNWIRQTVKRCVVQRWWFQTLILGVILLSCVLIGFEKPGDENPPVFFEVMESIVLGFFVLEMLLKMLVYTVLLGEDAYLKHGWNVLDFLVVTGSLVSIVLSKALSTEHLSWVQSFRLIRALRPLRALTRLQGGRSSLTALILAAPSFVSVTVMSLMLQLLFSIIAVDMFAGGKFPAHPCQFPAY